MPFATHTRVHFHHPAAAQSDLLEAAVYATVPSKTPATRARAKARPAAHGFVRYLLLNALAEDTVDDVLRLIRKLPWRDSRADVEDAGEAAAAEDHIHGRG